MKTITSPILPILPARLTGLSRLSRSALRVASALALGTAGLAQAAATLSVTGPQAVSLGASFSLQITAADVADLFGYQFDLRFDSALFRADGVSEGAFLPTGGTTAFDPGIIDNAGGTVSFVLGTLIGTDPGVSGSGALATLNFASIGSVPGSGSFQLLNVQAVDSVLADIPVQTSGLNVSAVPEPGTWLLALAGTGVLASRLRRRGQRAG